MHIIITMYTFVGGEIDNDFLRSCKQAKKVNIVVKHRCKQNFFIGQNEEITSSQISVYNICTWIIYTAASSSNPRCRP